MNTQSIPLPPVVPLSEWQEARKKLLAREKEATRLLDSLAAERRRLPMVEVEKEYLFDGPEGKTSLLDLFQGRRQLLVYHFMFGPDWEEGCPGCSWVADNMGHPSHLAARSVSRALISRAPLGKLLAYKKRMEWKEPWYSSLGSSFNADFGATIDGEEQPGLSVFLRDGKKIYRTYFTTGRGMEMSGSHWFYLDLTPWGRQEKWEISPEGWPQEDPYQWWRRHDRYENHENQ